MAVADPADVLRRLHEQLSARDPQAVDRFFAPGFHSHNMPPGLPGGVEGVRAFFEMLRSAFPDIEVRVDELVVDGDRAAAATTMTGTHEGELLGIAPTGRRVEFTGLDLVRVDELVVDGDRAAAATTMTGTHQGELLGIAPTGRRVEFTGLDLVRVDDDGLIAEHRGLTDTVGLLRQLS